MSAIRKGSTVTWTWGASKAEGKVVDTLERKVTRTIKGSKITKNGSKDNPVYEIEQADGDKVLKLRSELDT